MNSSREMLKKQMIGFAITGSLSTLLMLVLYINFNEFMSFQYAYLISYSTSVITLYFMNILFVFHKPVSLKSFLKFPLIYLFQYLVGAASLEFLVRFGVPERYAPLVVVVMLLPITFLLNRLVLLKH